MSSGSDEECEAQLCFRSAEDQAEDLQTLLKELQRERQQLHAILQELRVTGEDQQFMSYGLLLFTTRTFGHDCYLVLVFVCIYYFIATLNTIIRYRLHILSDFLYANEAI